MQDRLRDILLAAIVGDALGNPFNGLRHGHIQQVLGGAPEGYPSTGILFPDKPGRNVLRGLHSALGQRLVASLAAGRPDDLGREPIARAGAAMLELAGNDSAGDSSDFGALRRPGRPMRTAIARWRQEYPWGAADYFAVDQEGEGISTAPLGFVSASLNSEKPNELAVALARLTHARMFPLLAPLVISHLTGELLRRRGERKLDTSAIIRDLLDVVRDSEKSILAGMKDSWRDLGWGNPPMSLAYALAPLDSLLREKNDDLAEKTIIKTAGECFPHLAVTHVQHGFVPASLVWAVYRGLGPMPAVRAVEDVMNRGGECSAIASIVCGLMVARHGIDCLTEEWITEARITQPLYKLVGDDSPEAFEAWLDSERSWTAEESALQHGAEELLERKHRIKAEREKAAGKKPTQHAPEAVTEQDSAPFPPPPHIWLKPGEEEDPKVKKILKEARGKRRIDWKEERRKKSRD